MPSSWVGAYACDAYPVTAAYSSPSVYVRLYFRSLFLVGAEPVIDRPATMMFPSGAEYVSMAFRRLSLSSASAWPS